jgi:hypothetical protein
MCEPITIAAIAASGATQAFSQYQRGEGQASSAQYSANLQRAQAADALQRGETQAGQVRTAGSQLIGENKTAFAGAGVDVGAGSAAAAAGDVRAASELDVGTIRANAARAAWGHEAQAAQDDYAAKNARYQARLGMAGTFLGTTSSLVGVGGLARPSAGPLASSISPSGMGGPVIGAGGYYSSMPRTFGN